MGNAFRDKQVEEELMEELQPTPSDESAPAGEDEVRPEPRTTNWLGRLFGSGLLRSPAVTRQGWLVALIVFFLLIIVSNRYYVEKLSKEKLAIEERINFLSEKRMQMKKEYQESVKISRIVEELDSVGVGLIAGPPYELAVDAKRKKNNR